MTGKDLIAKIEELGVDLEIMDISNDFIEEVNIVEINGKQYIEITS